MASTTLTAGTSGGTHAIAQFRLRVVSGIDAGATFESRGERAMIGSHKSADFALTDPTVSRFHCELIVHGSGVDIADLGSRNGTVIDGVSVVAAHLKPGAVITLGKTQLHFETGDGVVRLAMSSRERFGLLVGRSPAMATLYATLERAAASDVTVLLQGETGSGKDAAAESIHQESDRRDGPFVVVDCGALPPSLIESELFGHERGAFTGAVSDRVGALEAADKGTLFLDEIGELPLDLQPKLLRAIERREVRRVGSSAEPTQVDVRIIAATNRNLRAAVNDGLFRADLYYRLAVIDVTMPPLRERPDDIPLIIDHVLHQLDVADAAAAGLRSPELAAKLAMHPWPGNVRELRNYVERCIAFDAELPVTPAQGSDGMTLVDPRLPLRTVRERWTRFMERKYLEQLLALHHDNVAAAARAAGVDRVHLHRLLARVGLR